MLSCFVTLPPSPPHAFILLLIISFLAGDQLEVRGGQRTFLATTRIRSGWGIGENRRTNEQTRTMLGVNSEQKESMQHYISNSIYGLTLAWITSENSTKQLECRHLLTQSSSLDPILSATVSGVDRICPWFHANPLCCPVANCLPALLSSQLSFASPYHFRIRRDFRSKNPLSGFAPKQTKESSAWRATHIVLQLNIAL